MSHLDFKVIKQLHPPRGQRQSRERERERGRRAKQSMWRCGLASWGGGGQPPHLTFLLFFKAHISYCRLKCANKHLTAPVRALTFVCRGLLHSERCCFFNLISRLTGLTGVKVTSRSGNINVCLTSGDSLNLYLKTD